PLLAEIDKSFRIKKSRMRRLERESLIMMHIHAERHAHRFESLFRPFPDKLFQRTEIIEIGGLYALVPQPYPFNRPASQQHAAPRESFDDPVAERLPTLPGEPFKIGIHQLLHPAQHRIARPEQAEQG